MTLMNMNLKEKEQSDKLFYERLAVSKAWVKRQLKRHRDSNLRGDFQRPQAIL